MHLRFLLAPHPTSFAEGAGCEARGGKEALIARILEASSGSSKREARVKIYHIVPQKISSIHLLPEMRRDLLAVVFPSAHAVIPASSQNGPAMKLVHGKKVASPSTRLSIL